MLTSGPGPGGTALAGCRRGRLGAGLSSLRASWTPRGREAHWSLLVPESLRLAPAPPHPPPQSSRSQPDGPYHYHWVRYSQPWTPLSASSWRTARDSTDETDPGTDAIKKADTGGLPAYQDIQPQSLSVLAYFHFYLPGQFQASGLGDWKHGLIFIEFIICLL